MSITSAIVLFAVIWFMVFLIVIPIRLQDPGRRGPRGTTAPMPDRPRCTTSQKGVDQHGVSIGLWIVIAGIILSGWITVRDLDFLAGWAPRPDLVVQVGKGRRAEDWDQQVHQR